MKKGFSEAGSDGFNPEYGEVLWKRRLNKKLEDTGLEIMPVQYNDGVNGPMQITQENTIIFWNSIADEMDCVAMTYPPESEEQRWLFREHFEAQNVAIEDVAQFIGSWCLQTMTLYPMANVVDKYEQLFGVQVPDELPDDFA